MPEERQIWSLLQLASHICHLKEGREELRLFDLRIDSQTFKVQEIIKSNRTIHGRLRVVRFF